MFHCEKNIEMVDYKNTFLCKYCPEGSKESPIHPDFHRTINRQIPTLKVPKACYNYLYMSAPFIECTILTSHLFKCLAKIGYDIFNILDANRKSDQFI
jgi:hypothetical protein